MKANNLLSKWPYMENWFTYRYLEAYTIHCVHILLSLVLGFPMHFDFQKRYKLLEIFYNKEINKSYKIYQVKSIMENFHIIKVSRICPKNIRINYPSYSKMWIPANILATLKIQDVKGKRNVKYLKSFNYCIINLSK